jgi:hypothetical protein
MSYQTDPLGILAPKTVQKSHSIRLQSSRAAASIAIPLPPMSSPDF